MSMIVNENNQNQVLESEDKEELANKMIEQIVSYLKEENYDLAKKEFLEIHYSDQSLVLESLKYEKRTKLIEECKSEITTELLIEVNQNIKFEITEILGYKKIASLIEEANNEDAISFVECFVPLEQVKILKKLSPEKRKELRISLSYPDESAGRIMDLDYVVVTEHFTVGQTLEYIRISEDSLPSTLYDLFVVDDKNNLVGMVSVVDLLTSKTEVKISEIMRVEVVSINVLDDKEVISHAFNKYNLNSAPVVSDENKIVGAMYVDSVKYITEEKNEEELLKMSGVLSDLDENIFDTTKVRFMWLFVNLLTTAAASWVISFFEGTIHAITTLAVLMPITVSMGSNAGTQTVTVVIRALATKHLNKNNFRLYFNKEFIMSIVNSVGFFFLSVIGVTALYKDFKLALVFGVAIVITLITSVVAGVVTPIVMKKLNTDPAVTAVVFLTTVIEIVAFLSFLGLAKAFLIH